MGRLVIDQYGKECIEILIEYANKHELSLQDVKDTIAGTKLPVGDNPKHLITLYDGYRVVYSIENQPKGKFRHISISVNYGESLPSVEDVVNISYEFGFNSDINPEKTMIYVELGKSINVVQLIDDNN